MQGILERICKPNPDYYPDLEECDRLFRKNKRHFLVVFLLFLLMFIKAILFDPNFITRTFRILSCMTPLISFLLFCRTRVWICYAIHTFFYVSFPFAVYLFRQDLAYFVLGISFLGPTILLLFTSKRRYFLVCAGIQLFTINTIFRPVLINTLNGTTTEEFAERMIGATSFQMVLASMINYITHSDILQGYKSLYKAQQSASSTLASYKLFLHNFSHEIRNPIHSLIGNIELALLQDLPAQVVELIKTAQICGEVLQQLINNILDTGKLEIGELSVQAHKTRIYDVVTRIWRMSSELIKKKDLTGNLKIHKKIPATVLIDSHRLNQILLNLLGNAIKFTEKGGIFMTIEWVDQVSITDSCYEPKPYEEEEEGLFEKNEAFALLNRSEERYKSPYMTLTHVQHKHNEPQLKESSKEGILKIIVRDTGCGMDKDAIPKLFKRFSQVCKEETQRQIGTGLGLFITKEVCNKMKGEIRVFSKVKIGTTFILCLPCQGIST